MEGKDAMKVAQRCLVLCVFGCMAVASAAQTPVGALAVDEGQGDQYGWAVDYETAATARARALGECGSGCSVVLTFERCAAYAADQDANSTALGWAESYGSAAEARGAALSECGSRGGSGCIVRVWGCNGPVVEEGLGLDRSARREIQQGLQGQGFDPGGADGMFGPRTRAAIRNWQTSQGARATGYLDGTSVAGLRSSVAGQTTFRQREQPAAGASARPSATAVAAARPSASGAPPAAQQGTAEQENLFWQSIVNSTDPADFEAYLEEFPNGVFRRLAQNRLAALRSPANDRPASAENLRPGARNRNTAGNPNNNQGFRVSSTPLEPEPARSRPRRASVGASRAGHDESAPLKESGGVTAGARPGPRGRRAPAAVFSRGGLPDGFRSFAFSVGSHNLRFGGRAALKVLLQGKAGRSAAPRRPRRSRSPWVG